MSYILDALKKAESERKLGSVPNVHASQVTTTALDHNPSIWTRPVTWIGLALVAATLAALVWRQPWQSAPTAVQIAAPSAISASDVPPAVVPPPVKAAIPVAQPAPLAVQSRPAVARPIPKPIASEPEKRQDDARPSQPAVIANQQPAVPVAEARPVVNTPAPAASAVAPPADSNVMTLRELPENIQRELPTLAISGYIYSSNPAERSILINRILRREGDEVAPGVILEKMMPKSAVMSYRGYRYRMSYR